MYSYTEEKDNKNRVLALLDYRLCWMELKLREKDFKSADPARLSTYVGYIVKN